MSDIEEDNSINETINESIEVNDGEPTKSLQKVKKPRSEKQIEALKKAQVKRAENIEKRKIEKEKNKKLSKKEKLKKELEELEKQEQINPSNNGMNEDFEIVQEENLECNKVGKPEKSSKELIEDNKEYLKKLAISKPKPKKKKPVKQTIVYQDESSSSEEEEIIIKKKPRKKKKKKVVYQSPSESSSEEEEVVYQEPVQRQKLRYQDVFKFG